jgi:DNA-binding CsgD family transcriptional regulator
MTNTSSCGAIAPERDRLLLAADAEEDIAKLELSLVVIDLEDLTVSDISWSALHRLNASPDMVVGGPAAVAFNDGARTTPALEAMRDGAIDFYRGGSSTWARAFTVGNRRVALVETRVGASHEPSPLTRFLGRDPGTMVFGTSTFDLVLRSISNEVEQLLGLTPAEFVGRSVLRAFDSADAQMLLRARDLVERSNSVTLRLRARDASGVAVRVRGILTRLAVSDELSFMLVRDDDPASGRELASIARLEQHLRNIADEVEASGVRTGAVAVRALPHFPGLTKRQCEVLSHLVQGERVSTIADALYISQSTVRNHLAAIFAHFQVHTQAELLNVVVTDLPRRRGS